MAKHMHSATRRALANRAISAATWMEDWAKRIEEEVKNGNPDIWERPYTPYDFTPLTLRRCVLQDIITDMRRIADEIRQFSDKR